MKTVLFLCTHNSARSQLAQGLLNHYYGDRYEALSAGTEATIVKPQAIEVMKEIGIDISHHTSKTLDIYLDRDIDYVVTVCDNAKAGCPFFPRGKEIIHHTFKDPSDAPEEEKLDAFRKTRDEIKVWIDEQFGKE